MPSSSAHDTYGELALTYEYKICYGRLYHSDMHYEAQTVTRIFAALLETPQHDLLTAAAGDRGWWLDLKDYAERFARSKNISAAGDALADAAAFLFRFGRDFEAGNMCLWAEELYERAAREELWERKEAEEQRYCEVTEHDAQWEEEETWSGSQ